MRYRSSAAVGLPAALSLLLLCACPSMTTMHTARPIEAGTTEIGFSVLAIGVSDRDGAGNNASAAVPSFEFQVRHAFTDWLELGAKVYPIGIGADLNILLVNAEYFALSVDPTISGVYFSNSTFGGASGSTFIGYFFLPVLADVVDTEFVSVTLGPKPGIVFGGSSSAFTGSTSGSNFLVGGMLGVKLRLGRVFRLMPEVDFLVNPDNGVPIWSAGIAVEFGIGGGDRSRARDRDREREDEEDRRERDRDRREADRDRDEADRDREEERQDREDDRRDDEAEEEAPPRRSPNAMEELDEKTRDETREPGSADPDGEI